LLSIIKRVCSLFFGHNELILGFNAFLPDDKKLKISDIEERAKAHTAETAAAASGVTAAAKAQSDSSSAPLPAAARHAGSGPGRELNTEDALRYLDQVCTCSSFSCSAACASLWHTPGNAVS
jgi:histone deacetylase complex regulatory component SIN3